MYTIFLLGAIGLIFGLRDRSIAAVITSGIAGMGTGAIVAILMGFFSPALWMETEPVELAAMRVSDGTSGVLILGTGRVGNATHYRAMIKNPDGSFRPFETVVRNGNTLVIEDASLTNSGSLKIWMAIDDPEWKYARWALRSNLPQDYFYEYRVPKGTVINQFNLN